MSSIIAPVMRGAKLRLGTQRMLAQIKSVIGFEKQTFKLLPTVSVK
jgi:hypothetical protein